MSEALKLVEHLGVDDAAALLDRMGLLLSHIADTITDDGDRAYLNSTNDMDRIKTLAEEWRHHRYAIHDDGQHHSLALREAAANAI